MSLRPRPLDYLLLVLLAAIWGASFLFIKVAVPTIPPVTLVAGRLVLGALGLGAVMLVMRQRLPRDLRIWGHAMVIAVVGNLVPFALIAWGEIYIDSGLAAILMASMPIAAILLAHVFTDDERLAIGKVFGVALGLCGILILVGPGALRGLGDEALAQVAVAGAAVCYAAAGTYMRVMRLTALPPAATSTTILLLASALALPLSLVVDQPWRLAPSGEALAGLLALGLLSTGLAYLIFFRLIARGGVTFMALNNYMVPLFGVLWGAMLLGESLGTSAFAALALILSGVALTQWSSHRKRAISRSRGARQ